MAPDSRRSAPDGRSAISVRIAHLSAKKYAGQARHDLRLGRQPSYVDRSRSALNRVLIEPPSAAEMRRAAIALRERQSPRRAMRSDAAVASVAVITFGREAQALIGKSPPSVQDEAYRDVAAAVADRYGAALRGLVVHADETAPHAHAVFDSRDAQGRRLSQALHGSVVQDVAAEAVRRLFPEITRGVPKASRRARGDPRPAWIHRSVKELHDDLPAELAASRAAAAKARAQAEALDRRVEKLREAERALGEREEKRLAAYERRRKAKLAEIEEIEAASAALAGRIAGERSKSLFPAVTGKSAKKDLAAAAKSAVLEIAEEAARSRRELEKEAEGLEAAAEARASAFAAGLETIESGAASPADQRNRWHVRDRARWNRVRHRLDPGPPGWTGSMWSALRAFAAAVAEPLGKIASRADLLAKEAAAWKGKAAKAEAARAEAEERLRTAVRDRDGLEAGNRDLRRRLGEAERELGKLRPKPPPSPGLDLGP